MRSWPWSRSERRRPLGPGAGQVGAGGLRVQDGHHVEIDQIYNFAAAQPVEAALLAEYIESLTQLPFTRSQLLCVLDGEELVGLCLLGGNLVPLGLPPETFGPIAQMIRRRGQRCSSVVGSADQVLGLWPLLRPYLGPAREVRADQPSLVIDHDPVVAPDPLVRAATREDLDILVPACVAMFTEEVGYSPLNGGGGYERRIRNLVDQGRSLVRIDENGHGREVVFKAELGTVGLGVAQVQGVWVHPRHRGKGWSAAGMAAVVRHARTHQAPAVSLYVNSYNTPALATYRRVGFRQVGTFATVLL